MLQTIQRLARKRDQQGASAVEYGLLVAAIAAIIVVIVFALGGLVRDAFQNTCQNISDNGAPGGATSTCATGG
jgi:pilus assembly protein Flp/PilA